MNNSGMQMPCDQRLLLIWTDDAADIHVALENNPGLRRAYIIAPAPANLPQHPAIQLIPLALKQSLPACFERDRDFFSEGKVSLYFGENQLSAHFETCCELQHMLLQFTQRHLSHIALRATRGWHILANEICNLPHIRHSADQLSDCWNGEPVVIVGAGPSLDDTVPILHRYRQRVRIIACDGAWHTLETHGIVPDLIASMDDSAKVWRYFTDHSDNQKNVPVAGLLQSCCQIARHHAGPFYFGRNGRHRDQFLDREFTLNMPVLDSGLCVGHTALELARISGASQIIMTGFDLGYKNGRFHPKAQPNPYYHVEEPPAENILEIESNDDEPMKTELSMLLYLHEFEKRIQRLSIPVINGTAGGAKIRHTLYQALENVLAPLPELHARPLSDCAHASAEDILRKLGKKMAEWLHGKNELSACSQNPELWQLIHEAINPALIAGAHFTKEDAARGVPGAKAEHEIIHAQLAESIAQQVHVVQALCRLTWPRPETGKAFNFTTCANPIDLSKDGIMIVPTEVDPTDLPSLWESIERENIDHIIMENGELLPAAWNFTGVQCINLHTAPHDLMSEHLIPGYQSLSVQ